MLPFVRVCNSLCVCAHTLLHDDDMHSHRSRGRITRRGVSSLTTSNMRVCSIVALVPEKTNVLSLVHIIADLISN